MLKRTLGKSKLEVSALGLGCMGIARLTGVVNGGAVAHDDFLSRPGRMLLGPDRNRGDVILPFQLKLACVAAGGDRILQLFDRD